MPTKREAKQAGLSDQEDSAIHPAYHDLLSDSATAFIFGDAFSEALGVASRECSGIFDVTEEFALEEFRRFLAIKIWTVDVDATKISPTALMDHMWHAAILNTKFYEELQSSLGATLHHNPAGAEDADRKNRQTRLENMKATYCHFFDKEPEELTEREPAYATRAPRQRKRPEWQIEVKTITGKVHKLWVHPSDLVDDVKYDIMMEAGVPENWQRLIFGGRQLQDGVALMERHIYNGATLHLVGSIRGC